MMPSGRPGGVPQPCLQLSVTQVRECPPHTDVARQSPSHCPFPPGRPTLGAGVPPILLFPGRAHVTAPFPKKGLHRDGSPTPYYCFLAEPMSLPLSPRKAHTGGRGPTPYCCFPAESRHCPCPPGGPALPTRTSPVEMCELISKTASLLFLLWRQDGRPLTRRSAPPLTREFSMSVGEKENQRLNQHKIIKALLLR